ncbi:MAG: hypothetical protein ABIP50_00425 [Candidatus Saccharimonadales bacterium]
MTHHPTLKIIAFVGSDPATVQTVMDHYTEKGYPKVSHEDMATQITNLSEAGQHHIVTDEITDFEMYHQLRHTFPGELFLIAILPSADIAQYKESASHEIQNWDEQKRTGHTRLLELAQYYIESDGHEKMYTHIHELFEELNFIN